MLGMISRKWERSVEHKENRCPFMFRLFFLASDRRRDALPSEANSPAEATEKSATPGDARGYFFDGVRLSRKPSFIAPALMASIKTSAKSRNFRSPTPEISPNSFLVVG